MELLSLISPRPYNEIQWIVTLLKCQQLNIVNWTFMVFMLLGYYVQPENFFFFSQEPVSYLHCMAFSLTPSAFIFCSSIPPTASLFISLRILVLPWCWSCLPGSILKPSPSKVREAYHSIFLNEDRERERDWRKKKERKKIKKQLCLRVNKFHSSLFLKIRTILL